MTSTELRKQLAYIFETRLGLGCSIPAQDAVAPMPLCFPIIGAAHPFAEGINGKIEEGIQ